jgi:tagatose 1,6-diphosphate aldolase
MAATSISKGKIERLNACADGRGIITALAVDHRTPLLKSLEEAFGPERPVTAEDMTAFKAAVTRVLTRHASAILLDPEYSLDVIAQRAPGSGAMLAYEKTGYDPTVKGRLPDLLPEWSVRRLVERGASGIKVLMYYNPFDDPHVTSVKQAFVERIGAECAANQVPFYLEPLAYDDEVGEDKSFEFAKVKPRYVINAMEEFSKPRYGVDVLKVDAPVNMKHVEGTRSFGGQGAAYTRREAVGFFREAAQASALPFIYLSAGVSDEVFREGLELAAEAGARYSGVLCGRATWQGGVAVYGQKGEAALEDWLSTRGVQNIMALNETVSKGAVPWWTVYGGMENITAD